MTAHRFRPDHDTNPGAAGTLDRLLQEAAGREWPGPNRNPRIEEFLMNEVTKKQRSRLGLLLGLGTLLATGAVFGAARLYQEYTVQIQCNGQTIERTVQAGPDGTATFDVALDGGGTATVLVGPGNAGPDGQIQVAVECVSGTDECTVQTTADAGGQVSLDCEGCPMKDCNRAPGSKPEPK
jgi:hypothetical protein